MYNIKEEVNKLKPKGINFFKIIVLTIIISILPITIFAKTPVKNLDGIYTLKRIETSTGEIKFFEYGGELTVKNNIATLKTSSKEGVWNLEGIDCEIKNNQFYQIDSKTKDKYIFEKLK